MGSVRSSRHGYTRRPQPCSTPDVSRRFVEWALASLAGAALLLLGACSSSAAVVRDGAVPPSLIVDVRQPTPVGGAGLQLRFSVRMSDGTDPPELGPDDIEVINDEVGRDFGDSNADGSRSAPRLPADFTLLTVLVLDFSDSVFKGELQHYIRKGVDSYLQALLVPSEDDTAKLTTIKGNHRVALVQLGRTQEVKVALGFTADPAEIEQAVAAMATTGGLGTTNLYAGYGAGIDTVTRQEAATPSVQRVVIVVTDSAHQAGNREQLRAQALALRERAASDVFTIGVGDRERLEPVRELASRPQFFQATGAEGMVRAFQEVAGDIVGLARRNYVVGICTPVELGSPTLTLRVTTDGLSAAQSVAYATDTLDGNTTDCDPDQIAAAGPGTGAGGAARRPQVELQPAPDADAEESRPLPAEQEPRPPGSRFRDCGDCPEMVVVPAGSYLMGSPRSEPGRHRDEGPLHRVRIAQPLAVGVYEVTFAEWDACVRDGGCDWYPPDQGWGRGRRPVIHVSWEDAQQYAAWLSGRTGERYRLLSEAEWEYVARAGTTTPFHTGKTISTEVANYNGELTYGGGTSGVYRGQTVPVGSFPANDFGLRDVHGNVSEWVDDCWHGSYDGAPSDGRARGSARCSWRVVRGGAWFHDPRLLRSAYRILNFTDNRSSRTIGFRVARTLRP